MQQAVKPVSAAAFPPAFKPPRRALDLRSVAIQVAVVVAIVALGAFLVGNVADNLRRLNISSGFGYLFRPAGFRVTEAMLPFSPTDSNGWAVVVGFLNTLRVFAITCVLATILGTIIGIARLSGNPLLSGLTGAYVDVLRNIPLLLQLFFWYTTITALPGPRSAFEPIPGVLLSNRGLVLPAVEVEVGAWHLAAVGALAVAALWLCGRAMSPVRSRERRRVYGVACGLSAVLFLAAALPVSPSLSFPQLKGFNIDGGVTLSPEFATILFGMTIYNSAFISEIVRAGVLSVQKGQWEAAKSLGLTSGRTLRLVVLPQALRVVIPPLTSQYLNVLKASSIAVAIGYPEIVSVSSTMIQLTGQAVEIIAVIMATFLTASLLTSLFMNWYNARILSRS